MKFIHGLPRILEVAEEDLIDFGGAPLPVHSGVRKERVVAHCNIVKPLHHFFQDPTGTLLEMNDEINTSWTNQGLVEPLWEIGGEYENTSAGFQCAV
jgi:hypothetical protein